MTIVNINIIIILMIWPELYFTLFGLINRNILVYLYILKNVRRGSRNEFNDIIPSYYTEAAIIDHTCK